MGLKISNKFAPLLLAAGIALVAVEVYTHAFSNYAATTLGPGFQELAKFWWLAAILIVAYFLLQHRAPLNVRSLVTPSHAVDSLLMGGAYEKRIWALLKNDYALEDIQTVDATTEHPHWQIRWRRHPKASALLPLNLFTDFNAALQQVPAGSRLRVFKSEQRAFVDNKAQDTSTIAYRADGVTRENLSQLLYHAVKDLSPEEQVSTALLSQPLPQGPAKEGGSK